MTTNIENYFKYFIKTEDPEMSRLLEILKGLPESDQKNIDRVVTDISHAVPKMGVMSAFELVAKLGVFLAIPGEHAPMPD